MGCDCGDLKRNTCQCEQAETATEDELIVGIRNLIAGFMLTVASRQTTGKQRQQQGSRQTAPFAAWSVDRIGAAVGYPPHVAFHRPPYATYDIELPSPIYGFGVLIKSQIANSV